MVANIRTLPCVHSHVCCQAVTPAKASFAIGMFAAMLSVLCVHLVVKIQIPLAGEFC